MKSTLDELLGSIYSLTTAHKLDYEDRIKKKKEDSVILNVAEELSQGIVRTDGKWVAGYFMNSATYRASSVYHRLLKIVTGDPSQDIGKLLPLVGAAFKEWTGGTQWPHGQLDRVQDEANSLKHTEAALYRGRTLWKEYSIVAIAQLLTLAETWVAQQKKGKAPGTSKMKSPAKGKT